MAYKMECIRSFEVFCKICRRSGETYCFHVHCCPEDGSEIFLRNVGSHLLVYNTVSWLTKWNAYDPMKCFAKYVGVRAKLTVSMFIVALKMEAVYSCEMLVVIYWFIIRCHGLQNGMHTIL
jgi:hypothetical protein